MMWLITESHSEIETKALLFHKTVPVPTAAKGKSSSESAALYTWL